MFKRLSKDESGMTMGLVVIMIVLIGVMGAGLLTFVQRDLEAVVEVNQGQKALEMADAGVQLAKQQLFLDSKPAHYDVDALSGSLETYQYNATCNVPASDPAEATPPATNWSLEGGGVTRSNLDNVSGTNDRVTVTIRWLNPATTESRCQAPEASPPAGKRYFQVISVGRYNGEATRKVEAILNTFDKGVPRAFFTTDPIEISGTATDISNVSLFTTNPAGVSISGTPTFSGTDLYYSNWQNALNPTARGTTTPGIGSIGPITGGQVSGRDYDSNGPIANFVATRPTSTSQITFPFDPGSQPDMTTLRREAERQGSLIITAPSGGNITSWPAPQIDGSPTVVFYDLSRPTTLKWMVNGSGSCNPANQRTGILVVNNGNFTTQPNKDPFQGVVVVRGGTADAEYDDTGTNTCFTGYANTTGTIKLAGNVSPTTGVDVVDTPGFYAVEVWSWREMYQ